MPGPPGKLVCRAISPLLGLVFVFGVHTGAPALGLFPVALLATDLGETEHQENRAPRLGALLDEEEEQPTPTPTTNQAPAASCPISSDQTFGYAKENPIRVGGGSFVGPRRARAYLSNLRGPNGEEITYMRVGSLPSQGTILDAYAITVADKSVTLYVDQYSYVELVAPVGFTCAAAFIGEP